MRRQHQNFNYMYQKDYIMRMIEELGRVLAALMGFREKGESGRALALIDETLTTHFDLNLDQLLAISEEDFLVEITMVTNEEASLNMIAEMLFQHALFVREENAARSLEALCRALLIFYYLDAESDTFNLGWQDRIEEIDRLVRQLEA